MKKMPGKDFGSARVKFPVGKIAKAIQMRADGHRLAHISKVTGISMGYISRLTRQFLARGKGRVSAATNEASLGLLQARLKKLETEAKEIRAHIKQLTGGGRGKPSDKPKGKVGASDAPFVAPDPGDEVLDVRDPAEGSR